MVGEPEPKLGQRLVQQQERPQARQPEPRREQPRGRSELQPLELEPRRCPEPAVALGPLERAAGPGAPVPTLAAR